MLIATPQTKAIAATLRSALETAADVVAACSYGSVTRGVNRPEGDADVALLLDDDPPETIEGLRLDLATPLGDELSGRSTSSSLNRAPSDLAHRVRQDDVILLDRNRRRRLAWKTKFPRRGLDRHFFTMASAILAKTPTVIGSSHSITSPEPSNVRR